MRKFTVQVNGSTYDVEVEEIASSEGSHQKVKTREEVPSEDSRPNVKTGGVPIKAPMPGTIMEVKVKAGDAVVPNTVVVVLEAMKMENEIFAGRKGTVSDVNVSKGDSVNTGDVIATLIQ